MFYFFKERGFFMTYPIPHAILPEYDACGANTTRLYLPDGTTTVLNLPIRRFMRDMLYEAHIDPRALHHWTYTILGTKLNTPLILNEHLIFIPFKARRAVSKSDGCFGYILLSALVTCDAPTLTLTTASLPTLTSNRSFAQKVRDAHLLAYMYEAHRQQYAFMHT